MKKGEFPARAQLHAISQFLSIKRGLSRVDAHVSSPTLPTASHTLIVSYQNLGLSDLNDVLANPPPGIDELVALSRVINITRSEK